MALIFILLFVYSLFTVSSATPYCRYPDLQAYPAPHRHIPIRVDDYNVNCLRYPSFNATIIDSALIVEDCVHAQYQVGASTWNQYTTPVPLLKGQKVFVKCDDSSPVLLVNPPTFTDASSKGLPSPNPSVFVVMVDAVAYEVLHRLMPNTVNMLKSEMDMEVYEFTKYPLFHLLLYSLLSHIPMTSHIYATVGLNSNPNKFALFGRHDYDAIKHEHTPVDLTWLWEHAKDLGYTTVIAEDECPRPDSVWELMNVHPFANTSDENAPDFVMLSQLCVTDPHPNKYCVKADYITSMIQTFEKSKSEKPIFMWSNFIDAHEPAQWAAALMDDTVVNYLRTIAQSSFMDNGVIVFVSDHGLHFGDFAYSSILGSAENKHPFMYIMAKKGVLNHDVVSQNQDKLVTPNDMYRTLSTLIGHVQKHDPRDIDIFSSYVPETRTCEMAGVPAKFCLCSYGPECAAQTLPSQLWETCVSHYAHPALFDWQYYTETHLKPQFGRDFTECEATMHWCTRGFSMGLNGTRDDSLRAYVARTPELNSHEFCWVWPNDCNWGFVAQHYFRWGYSVDKKT